MPHHHIDNHALVRIRREAKRLSRLMQGQSYMRLLDKVARDQLGVRHYHEARQLAAKSAIITTASPVTYYLAACQESYFEI